MCAKDATMCARHAAMCAKDATMCARDAAMCAKDAAMHAKDGTMGASRDPTLGRKSTMSRIILPTFLFALGTRQPRPAGAYQKMFFSVSRNTGLPFFDPHGVIVL